MRTNNNLTLKECEVALNAIRAETERTIREGLGDRVLQAYREWNEQVAIRQYGALTGP